MRREYVTVRRSDREWHDTDAKDFLARTVIEDHELIDIGVLDADGNRIMARKRIDPVGFVRWPEKD